MEPVVSILSIILPIIIVPAVGMIFRSKRIISAEGVDALKKLAVNLALPALLLNTFASVDYSINTILYVVTMYGLCVLSLFLGRFLKFVTRDKSIYFHYITTGFEVGMLGYALFILLYGQENMGGIASLDLGHVLFIFTCYKSLLAMEASGERPSGKRIIKDMLVSPVFVAIIIGIILGATGIYSAMIPGGAAYVLDSCADFISAPTAVIILFSIGYDLNLSSVPWKRVLKVIPARIITVIIFRLLAGMLVRLIGMGSSLDAALNIICILPPPFVIPVFAKNEEEQTYISASLSVYTIITLVMFAVITVLEI